MHVAAPGNVLTTFQRRVLVALAAGQPGSARLRWHNTVSAPTDKAGRGEILFCAWDGKLIASHTVRSLIRRDLLEPLGLHCVAFARGIPYRDYEITARALALL